MRKRFIMLIALAFLLTLANVRGVKALEVTTAKELYNCLISSEETECKLMNDIDVADITNQVTYISANNSDKTLDLNNYTLDLSTCPLYIRIGYNITIQNGTMISDSTSYTIYVYHDATLTLNNVSVTSNTTVQAIVVNYNGAITLNDSTLTSDTASALLYSNYGSDVTINNSKVTLNTTSGKALYIKGQTGYENNVLVDSDSVITGCYAITIDGVGNNTDASGVKLDFYGKAYATSMGMTINGLVKDTTGDVPVINIYDGAVIEADPGVAIYAAGYGIWNIYGGELTGNTVLSIKSGVFNITGGTFNATGEYVETPDETTGVATSTGSAISITYNDDYAQNVELNIANATVISENGYALYEENQGTESAVTSIAISSGSFEGAQGAINIASADNEVFSEFITGGTFSSEVEESFISQTLTQKESDGVYIVGAENNIVINEFANGQATVSQTSAIKGETIKINITLNDGYVLNQLTVVDASGNEIEVVDNEFVMPDSDVTITVSAVQAEVETPTEIANPQTGDNIIFYLITLLIGISGLIGAMIYNAKKNR